MNAETLKALKGSIAKWKRIAAGRGYDKGSRNCPLCQLFNSNGIFCKGCPVYERTKKCGCLGTPYEEIVRFHKYNDAKDRFEPRLATVLEYRYQALLELEFLQSLLPK